MMEREIHKETTLRARLHDLGIEKSRTDQVYVHAKPDGKDVALIPWDIVYQLFNRVDGAMGTKT